MLDLLSHICSWLPTAVSNLNSPVHKVKNPELNDEEKKRLIAYMNVLIEMDRVTDKIATNETLHIR